MKEDILKSSKCLEIIYKPYYYKVCLFGKDCINEWLKIILIYPIRYENFK